LPTSNSRFEFHPGFAVPVNVPFSLTRDSAAKAELSVSVSPPEKLGEYAQEKES
jgi:hypothetical protein